MPTVQSQTDNRLNLPQLRTSLRVSSETLDRALLDRVLQLKPDICDAYWVRNAPPKTSGQDLEQQLWYWCRLFRYRRSEKNELQRQGYQFTIQCRITCLSPEAALHLSEAVVEELAKLRFALEILFDETS